MFCPKCGQEFQGDVCPSCGILVTEAAPAVPNPTTAVVDPPAEPVINPNLMFCSKCGKQIDKEAIVCPFCGVATQNFTQKTAAAQPVVNVVNNNNNVNTNTNVNRNYSRDVAYPYKSKIVALLLCFFLGGFGIHRVYVGKIGTGLIWLFTVGFFGFGWVIDFIIILIGGFRDKAGMPLR